MKNLLPLLTLLLTVLCGLPGASLYSQDRLTADPQITLDGSARSDFFALSADSELKSQGLPSSTCTINNVASANNDPWSEECYLNDDCSLKNVCNANDVNLLGAYLADIDGNPISTCEFMEPTTVYLWGRFQNGTNQNRWAVRTRTEVWKNGEFFVELNSCSSDKIEPGATNQALIGEFEFECGEAIEFRNTFVAWETQNNAQCSDPGADRYRSTCNHYGTSKCSVDLSALVLLSPNFAYTCAEITETTTEVCFQNLTSGGEAPVDFIWDFNDGNTSNESNPCHTFNATTGTYNVTLTATDDNGVSASATLPVDLDNLFCPNPQLSITKSTAFNEGCVSEGDIIVFDILVKNTGNQNISNIVVTDPMLDYTSVQFNLTPNAERSYTVNYTIQQSDINAGGFTNTAIATGITPAFNEISVSDEATVALNGTPSLEESITDADCKGAATGMIELRASGGNAPYSFEWAHDDQLTGPDALNLTAGSYTVTLTDANGCSVTETYVVKEPAQGLELVSITVTDESCPGAADGSVTIVVNGGTPPLSIFITDGNGNVYPAESDQLDKSQSTEDAFTPVRRGRTTSSTPTRRGVEEEDKVLALPSNRVTFIANNLPAGDFDFVVTDENGCELPGTFIVLPGLEIVFNADSNSPVCEGAGIMLSASSSMDGISYSWTGPNNFSSDVANPVIENATQINAGTYTVTATIGECSVSQDVVVVVNELPEVEIAAENDGVINCTFEQIKLTASGSATGNYSWTGPDDFSDTGNEIFVSEPGVYQVVFENENGCTAEASVTVEQDIDVPAITISGNELLTCELDEITLTANVAEGVTVLWNGEFAGAELLVSEPGLYTAVATAENGCTATASVTVEQDIEAPIVTHDPIAPICFDELPILLGSGTYSGQGVYEEEDLSYFSADEAGEYVIIYSEISENGCEGSVEVSITILPTPIVSCPTDFTIGIIAAPIALTGAEPEGGEYSGPGVENGIFDPAVAGLGEHTIYYTYEAENECTAICSFVITVVEMPDFACMPDFSVCNDDMPVTLEQENYAGGVFSGEGVTDNVFDPQALEPGVYEITYTYTDELQHVYTCFFYITVHPAAEASLEAFEPVCSNTEAFVLEGGLPEGGVYYVNGVESTMFDPMAAADGIHEISYVFTDANGCTATAVEQIEVLLAPCVEIVEEVILCHGEETGSITVDITCGDIAKICLLYPGESIEQCLDDKATSVTFNGLAPGTYTVIVKAVNGCVTVKEVTITQPQEPLAISGVVTDLEEWGDGSGAISVTVTGGTPPYEYMWDSGQTTADIDNLQAGTYFVTVIDALGCVISDEFEVGHGSILVDLGVTIEVNIQTPDPDEVDELIFALVVTNYNQEEDATGVVVENIIPEPFPFIARLDDGTSGSFDPATGMWNLGTVPAGEYRILVYRTEMLLTEEEEKSWQYGVNTAQILPFDQIDPILENNYAEIVVTIGESTSGDDNGIESNGSMASQLALRNHRRMVEPNHIPRAERAERMASFSHTDMLIGGLKSATVEGQDPTGISMLLPEEGPANTRAFVSTPADLMGITNAKEMFAVDYLQENNSRRAAILAISTEPSRVYEHTKVICDRLVGAELRDINIMNIAGKPFIVSQLVHPNGYVDYSVSFIAQRKNGRFVIDNRWYNEEYELYNTDDVFNFQVWSVTPQFTRELVEDILEMMEQTGGVEFRNQTLEPQIPQVFVHSGRYTNGGLLLNLVNKAGADRITIQGNKTLVENGERVPMNVSVSIPTQEFVEVFIPTGYLFDAGFAIKNNKDDAPDVLYYADGAWMIDYDPGNAFVADFDTYKETAELEARDYKVERDATFSGSVRTWASMFRALSPRNAPVDLSSYNQVVFTASGKGTVEVMLAKAGIHNWGEQYRTTITLTDSPKEYVIAFRELANREGVREFTPEDVVSVIFNPVGNGNAETAFEVNVSNLHFTNSLFVQKNNAVFYPAYPNPFRNQTSVDLSLMADNPVKVEVLNVFGQVVEVIKNEVLEAGSHKINWDAARHTPGVYMIRLTVGTDVYTTKVIHQR